MPTTLVYEAWNNTPKPILYDTSDGKKEIQKEIIFKLPETHEKYNDNMAGRCVLCGKEFNGGFESKHLLGDTFNDWDVCKSPESRVMCKACAFTLLLNMEHSRCKLNTYSFVADETLSICNRQQVRDYLVSPPKPPFIFIIAVSQKKHLVIKSEIAYDDTYFPVQWEEERVYCDAEQVRDHIMFAEALRGIGFTKEEILTGGFNSAKASKFNASTLLRIEEEILARKKERSYALAVFAAQIQSEEEAECCLVSLLKMSTPLRRLKSSMPSIGAETKKEGRQESICGRKSNGSRGRPQNEQMELEIF